MGGAPDRVEFSSAMCQGLRAWDRVVFPNALSPPLGGGVSGVCSHCAPSSLLEVKLGTVAMLPLHALDGAHEGERTAYSCLGSLTCHLGKMTMGTSVKEPRCLMAGV